MKENWKFFMLLGLGGLVGSSLNWLLGEVGAPLWLVRELPLGFDPPFSMNLAVCTVTFGLTVNLSLLSILGMAAALFLMRGKI